MVVEGGGGGVQSLTLFMFIFICLLLYLLFIGVRSVLADCCSACAHPLSSSVLFLKTPS